MPTDRPSVTVGELVSRARRTRTPDSRTCSAGRKTSSGNDNVSTFPTSWTMIRSSMSAAAEAKCWIFSLSWASNPLVSISTSRWSSVQEKGACRLVLGNGISYLHEQQEGSIGAVFSAQVIEHLEYEDLVRFHEEAYRALQSGGVLIAETVNPHSIRAFKSFWTDLTHRVPIFPEVAVMLCLAAGFSEAHVLFPNGTGQLEVDRWSQGEYAVIARK